MKCVDEHGRVPEHGEDRDIFERLYAVRLDRLNALARFRPLLEPLDKHGLLGPATDHRLQSEEELDDARLCSTSLRWKRTRTMLTI